MDIEIRRRPHDDVGPMMVILLAGKHAPTNIYAGNLGWMKMRGCVFPDRNESEAMVQRVEYPEGWKVQKHASTTNYTYLAVVDEKGALLLCYRIDHHTGQTDTYHRDMILEPRYTRAAAKLSATPAGGKRA